MTAPSTCRLAVVPFALAAILLVSPSESSGQRVTSADARGQMLEVGRALLYPEAEDFEVRAVQVRNPFISRAPEAPAVVEEAPDAPEPDRAPARLADAEALRIIAQNFRPRGAMIVGDRRLLNLGGGRTMEEGGSFNARIREQQYEVRLSEVTEAAYVLQIGDATLRREFSPAAGRGGAQFDTPAREETDP